MAGFVRTLARYGPFQFAATIKFKTKICNLSFNSGIQFMCSAKTICYRTGETDIYSYCISISIANCYFSNSYLCPMLHTVRCSTGQLEDAIFTEPQLQLQLWSRISVLSDILFFCSFFFRTRESHSFEARCDIIHSLPIAGQMCSANFSASDIYLNRPPTSESRKKNNKKPISGYKMFFLSLARTLRAVSLTPFV